jgi:hypothetical protein
MKLPAKLYHGTSSRYLPKILKKGLLPRTDLRRKSHWEANGTPSAEDRVYLTTAYAPYFGYAGTRDRKGDTVAVLEIDTGLIPATAVWVADEDAIAYVSKATDPHPLDDQGEMVARTAKARQKALQLATEGVFGAAESLNVMGTCAVIGHIPPEAITRYVTGLHPIKTLLMWDAVVSPINYRFLGGRYEQQTQELFEPQSELNRYLSGEVIDHLKNEERIPI